MAKPSAVATLRAKLVAERDEIQRLIDRLDAAQSEPQPKRTRKPRTAKGPEPQL